MAEKITITIDRDAFNDLLMAAMHMALIQETKAIESKSGTVTSLANRRAARYDSAHKRGSRALLKAEV